MAKIMLVEDDKALREIYSIRLVAEGYNVVSAGDGEEALAMAVRERPDLIISDVMMPKISGFDMLDIIRSTPETKNIKVIMMTALSSEDQRKRGESLGADLYLVKSQVGIEDVITAVHQILGDQPNAGSKGNIDVLAALPRNPAPTPDPMAPVSTAPVATPVPPTAPPPAAIPVAPAAPAVPETPPAPAPIATPVAPEVPPAPVAQPAPVSIPVAAAPATPPPAPVNPVPANPAPAAPPPPASEPAPIAPIEAPLVPETPPTAPPPSGPPPEQKNLVGEHVIQPLNRPEEAPPGESMQERIARELGEPDAPAAK